MTLEGGLLIAGMAGLFWLVFVGSGLLMGWKHRQSPPEIDPRRPPDPPHTGWRKK